MLTKLKDEENNENATETYIWTLPNWYCFKQW